MMNLLESPLEALAFNYVSFGISTVVNNLWTWVAVITAAVSFWRIRNASVATSFSEKPNHQARNERVTSERESQAVTENSTADPESCIEPPSNLAPASLSVSDVEDVDGVTKGKFTLYYYESDYESEAKEELTAVNEWEDEFSYGCGEWWESWKRVMRVRKGEKGWYNHQDLTVVNGNVVRFWDDECRMRGRYSSCCAAW